MRHASSSAAALAAVALLVSACSSDLAVDDDGHGPGGGPGDIASPETPTQTEAPDTTPSPTEAVDPLALGQAVDLGPGVVVGAPDADHLWITAEDRDTDQMGCEGVPFEFLWTVDPATGARERAFPELPDDNQPFVTGVRLSPHDPSRVLFVSGCEGFLGRIDVGDVQPDGTVTGLVELPYADAELAGQSIRWHGPDTIVGTGIEAYGTPGLYLHDLDNGEWMDLDNEPYVDWLPLGDGLAAEVLFDQVRIVDADGVVVDSFAASTVESANGDFPLLAAERGRGASAGRTLLVEGVGSQRLLDEFEGFGMSFSPDGRFAAWTTQDPAGDDTSTTILELSSGVTRTVPDVWFAGIHWLGNGIAYTAEGPLDDFGFGTPTATFRPWVN